MFCYLGYVVLFVDDLDRALTFYREKVGLSVRFQDKGYAELAVAGSKFALLARSRLPELVGAGHTGRPASSAHEAGVTLLVEDVDRVHRDLTSRGISFLGAPQNRPWGQRTAYFQDTEGHLIEIATNLPRAPRVAA